MNETIQTIKDLANLTDKKRIKARYASSNKARNL